MSALIHQTSLSQEDKSREQLSDVIDSSSQLGRLLRYRGYRPLGEHQSRSEALIWASEKGDYYIVQTLLNEGTDVNSKFGRNESTALHFAASAGQCEIVALLADAKADLDVDDNLGNNALYLAATYGHTDVVKQLIHFGADYTRRFVEGKGLLHIATERGHCEVIKVLHATNLDINQPDDDGRTPVHQACFHNKLEALQLLIRLGANIHATNSRGQTPLHDAAQADNAGMVQALVESGADITVTDEEGVTAFHEAALRRSQSVVQLLLEYGVDVDEKCSSGGVTALTVASMVGCTEIVRLLLEHHAAINTMDVEGNGALQYAATSEYTETMQFLLENGADIEARNYKSETPLLRAASAGAREAVRVLVENGADLGSKDFEGLTVLHRAVDARDKPLVRYLLKTDVALEAKTCKGRTALSFAAELGDKDLASLLLASGADITTVDDRLRTPLHHAAREGWETVVEVLTENGADPSAEMIDGRRPEALANEKGHEKVASLLAKKTPVSKRGLEQLRTQSISTMVASAANGNISQVTQLLDRGIEIDSLDLNGRSAISAAAEHGQDELINLLIQQGGDVNLRDENGETGLWWASRYGHNATVRLLLGAKAAVDLADSDGQTPLSAAAQKGHDGVVGTLLDKGSNPNTETLYGKTPLIFAAAAGHTPVVKLLINSGAEIDLITPRDETALSVAEANGHEKVVELLKNYNALNYESGDETSEGLEDNLMYSNMLIRAAANGRVPEILRLLRIGASVDGSGRGKVPLVRAANGGYIHAVTTLLGNGAEVDIPERDGLTALGAAARSGHPSIVRLLQEQGANVNHKQIDWRMPLSMAAEYGHDDVVRLLIELGAWTDAKDKGLRTPLWHAVSNNQQAVIDTLLEKGANVDYADNRGQTPLLMAVRNGNLGLCKLLLEKGAHMSSDTAASRSPLSLAAQKGYTAIVELLVDHGADLNHLSYKCRTPLILAVKEDESMVVKILIEAGADINVKDDNHRTALSYVKESGNEIILKLFTQAAVLRQSNERVMAKAEHESLARRHRHSYEAIPEGFIRVIELHPGKTGDIISFELTDVDLSKSPSFEALSYEWKGKVGTIPVQCNRDRLLVTPNCEAALKTLRSETGTRVLWIDAVCINQDDAEERNTQVAMMTEIYRKAKAVLMWTGKEEEYTGLAFSHIPTLSYIHEQLCNDPANSLDLAPFEERQDLIEMIENTDHLQQVVEGWEDLSSRSYFRRAWVFQEVILAGSRGVVMCGKYHCPWNVFKSALLGYGSLKGEMDPSITSIMYNDNDFSKEGQLDLYFSLYAMTTFGAGDGRDRVFATLGLTPQLEDGLINRRPVADYTKSVEEVFIDTSRYLIEWYGMKLWDFIYEAHTRSSPEVEKLPSWAVDFTRPVAAPKAQFQAFDKPQPIYENLVIGQPVTTPLSLHVDGCILDRVVLKVSITKERDTYDIVKQVVQCMDRFGRGIYDLYPSIEKKVGGASETTGTGMTIGQALLTALLFNDREYPGNDIDIVSFLAWKLLNDDKTPSKSKHAPAFLQSYIASWDDRSRECKDFDLSICRRMEKSHSYDMDIVYTEKGYFGVTYVGGAEDGMVVALIGGCSQLSLLREKSDSQNIWYENVAFVCYYGWTDDNIKKLEDIENGLEPERLEIR
ncbi:hypothetical protein Daesc_009635 [Daldinia eschscholtzii]|uniref:Heterokaryon incompatibility domain-containing protein n=1 Tax=Daldinia eschscholtzii TaxID=292717 RepID=A0AAX6MBI0_9PEZI